jgi:RNA polymerase sigma factor (sigma-70 family)
METALMDAARAGDASALERVLALCQPNIRRYAQRSCLVSDVDDGVQEALLVLSRYLSTVRHAAALSRWLFRVVQRECRRLARRALRADPWNEGAVDDLLARHTDASLRLDLASALESLPAHYREAIVLRDFEELTIGEMAARLGEKPPAIKSRLHRARQLIREYLVGSA